MLLIVGVGAAACDSDPRPPDAATPPSALTGEISVRFDASPQKPASISVLAFRAAIAGIDRADVLGIVDPLAAAAPDHDCILRDLDLSASALLARGGSIELQEMSGIGIGLGSPENLVRPFPRLYPDVATVVGGVVAETGPLTVEGLPERLQLLTADSELAIEEIAVPSVAHVTTVNGAATTPGMKVDTSEGLVVGVVGGAGTALEIRPFGATVALACSLGSAATTQESLIIVPRAQIIRLFGESTPARAAALPASLDVVRRNRVRNALLGIPTRLSVEVRSSMTVELHP
ncbi:MAG TPA: hypothetical protein VGL59_12605 [Polyangia bacterium]